MPQTNAAEAGRIFNSCVNLAMQVVQAPAGMLKFENKIGASLDAEIGTLPGETDELTPWIEQTLAADSVLVIDDIDAYAASSNGRRSGAGNAIRFYAGVAVRGEDGAPCAVLAVMDYVPRTLQDHELASLQTLAEHIALQVAMQGAGHARAEHAAPFGPAKSAPAARIQNLRTSSDARRLEDAVRMLAVSASSTASPAIFEDLVRRLATLVGADGGFVARLTPGYTWAARTMTAMMNGQSINSFDWVVSGTPWESLLGQDAWLVLDDADAMPDAMHYASPQLAAFGRHRYIVVRRLDNPNGQPTGMLAMLFREPTGQSEFVMKAMDIFAARAAAELERRDADARLQAHASLLDKAQDAIIVCGLDSRITFWNKSAERLYGWTAEEAVGQCLNEFLIGDAHIFAAATSSVLDSADWRGEMPLFCKNGTPLTVEAHWTLVKDDDSETQSILAIHTDITQRKKTEAKIQHLAFYDQLTGLPNRMCLYDRLLQALASSNRSGHFGALMFIDLDNFKTLNDTLGHDMGDLLLQQVSLRLSACVREADTAARFGGDEFVVLLEELSENAQEAALQAKNAGKKILAALDAPYPLADYMHVNTSSIGITVFKGHDDNADEILKRADLAMYQAKMAGRNAIRFFDPVMQAAVTHRLTLEADLRSGTRADEFRLFYQPQVDSQGIVIAMEALIRWQQPARGLVPPTEFIPLAEETGLILSVGHWVLETACQQLADWTRQDGLSHLSIAVNVSARQFHHPEFVDQVRAVLNKTGADPGKLKLELTESVLIDDVETTVAKMATLKAYGISFSLDDFGTGYSSLSYLKRLPLDQLKIDQSFVRDVLTDPNDAAIACTIVALGKSLGLDVIAEGVETAEQRDFLASNGCHTYQGYFFGRPQPAEQFGLLARGRQSQARHAH